MVCRLQNWQQLFTSAAQMFDERGRGFILKGKRAQTETRGRHPYMAQEDARQLISDVLEAYNEKLSLPTPQQPLAPL